MESKFQRKRRLQAKSRHSELSRRSVSSVLEKYEETLRTVQLPDVPSTQSDHTKKRLSQTEKDYSWRRLHTVTKMLDELPDRRIQSGYCLDRYSIDSANITRP